MKLLMTGGSGFIGTNAIEVFTQEGLSVLDYSVHPPLKPEHSRWWHAGDILDATSLRAVFDSFQPDWIIHLAARADCDENTTVEEGYRVNTEGTQNVLEAIQATASVKRVIITSSQFVCGPGPLPRNDKDYFPETVYGASKVITEELTRKAKLSCCWTIIRPTNVWGPWHMRYRREFWHILQRGLYLHPGREPVIRSYGYVKNVVYQIKRILELPVDQVSGKTFYLGDAPADLMKWVDGFSRALAGRGVRIVPRPLMRALALLGDIPTAITGRPFYLNSSRYRSMVTNYRTPMESTFQLLGENPYSLEDGIKDTVEWLGSFQGTDRMSGGA